ncbi:DeoR/GlpR family DNA-binding transcription regulator [Vagococcus lutrae]|uniref:DeoR/GlpR family DNA-binding transcription regulator n=1 Tax=Vagococcus lutrae TaxID=81947 RepID=A0AAE9XFZ6_9ENTE|nr:DeoR/GlpR family DNA-binding transcription regulator [Vagococcus lutrae]MCO7150694.1 DeoR/GlpR family DNA-binding transcription regulator [Vagococcus lutrae]MDT2801725.1 DeoR/GlpR family DNA-binding transcription regulator [Vagococcus lutrae]MDT2806176.1 DeoR/GlpR family DNA-binding transcription regulator [Vagococcus lutrae]MDT2812116.1 DeoR/GlpR family DNA-binding transcription regulator [Vagococcus lutrae]MDT2818988.1 DeoR/GlpR family DNA-binding transcription regulator [Vagococcus lutra
MKAKRNDLIKEYILEKEHVTLKELEETFNVSMNTIRRDVAKIITDPRFEKVYGGVSVKKNKLISFENRSIKNKEVKQKIAEEAAKLIQPHDLIYIDSGTTTKYILDYLPKDIEMTIITNSLDIVLKAEVFEKIQVFLLGNMFKRSTRSFVGITPDQITNKYNISKAFMAATAVSIDNGMMNSDLMEYEIKKHIVDKAANIYLLADKSKFEKSTLLTYASLDQVDKIITDKDFDTTYLDFFNDKQIEPITVDI